MSDDIQSVAPTEGEALPVEANTEQAPESTPEPTTETQPEPKPKTPDWQRSINRLTKQKYQLQARLEEMERRLSEPQRPQAPAPGEPKIEDFQDFHEYNKAVVRYEAKQLLEAEQQEARKRYQQESAQRHDAEIGKEWEKRISKVRETIPDFDDVLEAADDITISDEAKFAIVESDLGPQVAYYLATHPEEARKLNGLSPVAVVRAIGRIEARIESEASVKKQSQAPKPVTPVGGGSASSGKDPGKMTDKEWAAWVKKGRTGS